MIPNRNLCRCSRHKITHPYYIPKVVNGQCYQNIACVPVGGQPRGSIVRGWHSGAWYVRGCKTAERTGDCFGPVLRCSSVHIVLRPANFTYSSAKKCKMSVQMVVSPEYVVHCQ